MKPNFRFIFLAVFTACAAALSGQTPDPSWIYGIHWYGNTNGIQVGDLTDVETMTGGKGIWVLENMMLDGPSHGESWEVPWQTSPLDKTLPGYKYFHARKVMEQKGHSIVWRLAPWWGSEIPSPTDSYTSATFADDCKYAANILRNHTHIWQIGNELNLGVGTTNWSTHPTPADYAGVYVACRDKIHEVVPNTVPATQVVLMQPNAPGVMLGDMFMDSSEFLWRQIEAVSDKAKIDGFSLHSYTIAGQSDNYYIDAFWDEIREQLMIIDEQGLGDRPTFISEWAMYMPTDADTTAGAQFLHRAYQHMATWNGGTGGQIPGTTNHNILGATWFVYPPDTGGSWEHFSLAGKKLTAGNSYENNPWLSFQHACSLNLSKGAYGGGQTPPQSSFWWRDTFDGSSLDASGPLPDWKTDNAYGGSVAMSGDGAVRFLGNSSPYGIGGIRSTGYVFGNFRAEFDVTFTNPSRIASDECNFGINFREGSRGYTLTFYPSTSAVNPNQVRLRQIATWTTLKTQTISGGINAGESFHVTIIANGPDISAQVKRSSGAVVLDWTGSNKCVDSQHKVGWVRLGTYNLNEVRVTDFQMGGSAWDGLIAGIGEWGLFD